MDRQQRESIPNMLRVLLLSPTFWLAAVWFVSFPGGIQLGFYAFKGKKATSVHNENFRNSLLGGFVSYIQKDKSYIFEKTAASPDCSGRCLPGHHSSSDQSCRKNLWQELCHEFQPRKHFFHIPFILAILFSYVPEAIS